MTTQELLVQAKAAAPFLAKATSEEKDHVLHTIAEAIITATDSILTANAADMENAAGRITPVMLDRLRLDEKRIKAMADGIREVANLPDPVGEELSVIERPNGLVIRKERVPLGVIAIIYESRPNVTSDAAALALKSGNACVLRSGRDAWRSADAITRAMQSGLEACGFPKALITLIEDTDHRSANEMMNAVGLIDLLIPRGGAGLIRTCVEQARVPCIQTGTGICHVYVDASADQEMALRIIENAKTSRPSVCNAEEVCIVHEAIAADFLPKLKARLVDARVAAGLQPVELRLDKTAAGFIPGTSAGEKDFDTEFLDYILAVKVVRDIHAAIDHISAHSTGHSEAIIAQAAEAQALFTACIDAAAVYVNASTRFTDGGEFGLGCEMGISTQKLHARGPMGLQELTSYKYIVFGNGQTR